MNGLPADSVKLLAEARRQASQPDEKRAVATAKDRRGRLSYNAESAACEPAQRLELARASLSDGEVAAEDKDAVTR